MKHLKFVFSCPLFILLFLTMSVGSLQAQPPANTSSDQGQAGQMGGGPMGQQGGPGGMQVMQQDPAQMQQMMAQRYKELLGMSDEEWSVIGPYVLKVATLSASTQTRGGMRMLMGRGNMQQGQQSQQSGRSQTQTQGQSQTQGTNNRRMMGQQDENLQALQTLLEDKNATNDEIKSKLSALRKARETSKQELIAAQKQLRELLTLRQEAELVVMGLLE